MYVASGAEHPATDSLVIGHWRLDRHEKQHSHTYVHTHMCSLYVHHQADCYLMSTSCYISSPSVRCGCSNGIH